MFFLKKQSTLELLKSTALKSWTSPFQLYPLPLVQPNHMGPDLWPESRQKHCKEYCANVYFAPGPKGIQNRSTAARCFPLLITDRSVHPARPDNQNGFNFTRPTESNTCLEILNNSKDSSPQRWPTTLWLYHFRIEAENSFLQIFTKTKN